MACTQVVPTKAVLYTRVSTDQQAQSGLGLEAQLAACQKVAELRGLEVIGVETDMAISGKDDITRRPGLTRLLQLAGAKEDVAVIVYSLSRLSRRQRLTWDLLDDRGEHRLKVISATEPFDTSTPMGRAMLGMLAVWAQLEADMCGERTRAALQAKKAQGKRLGPPTTAQKNPETVRQIQELFASGRFPTVTALLAEVQRLGIKTNRGGRWHRTSLGRVLGQNVPDKSA